MPTTSTSRAFLAAPEAAKPQSLWNEIVRWSMEASILRKEGREAEVAVLLQDRLPGLIRSWSKTCGLPSETAKENLRALFRRIQENIETGYLQRRMIVEEVCARLTAEPAMARGRRAEGGRVGLRRRIPIDDVPGMLDAVAEAEVENRDEAILPMRQAARSMFNLFSGEPGSPAVLTA